MAQGITGVFNGLQSGFQTAGTGGYGTASI